MIALVAAWLLPTFAGAGVYAALNRGIHHRGDIAAALGVSKQAVHKKHAQHT